MNFLTDENYCLIPWRREMYTLVVVFHNSVPFEYRILLEFHYGTEVGDIWQTIEFFAFE